MVSMTTPVAPVAPVVRGFVFRPISRQRWRVIDRRGRVIGHLRWEHCSEGLRFHAERFDLVRAQLRPLGSFWTAREAVDCLVYLR
ncbi:DNA mismatch repair protein [Microbacterium sp. VKM Ac-2870]|uniref:DNA mismatch repair protein n=1 Tax=Microbacterium sp. VKM Ac-2870 TaxID=2783825 RepID=UPI001E4D8FF0|nr:DNA mismatch repair protein [Microbacterium sp. VKM Ac-2870]